MSEYKPKDVFLGVIDLFAVLLPGAVLCFFFVDTVEERLLAPPLGIAGHAEVWAAFLVASYLLGHFLSLVGGFALDKVYDRIRPFLKDAPERYDAGTPSLQKRARGALAGLLGDAYVEKIDSAVKWSTAFIAVARPDLSTELQRKEADQKLFRSLAIALAVAYVRLALRGEPASARALACLALIALALWRFVDQRMKYSHLCYWYVIALIKAKQAGLVAEPTRPAAESAAE